MTAYVPYALEFYYLIGVVWFALGFIPGGWLKHELSLWEAAAITVIYAMIWPFYVGKIIWDLAHGRQDTDLP